MKKFLMLLLCAVLMFSFVACDEPEQPLPHEHSWDNGTADPDATCTTTGKMIYKCACGETKEEVIPLKPHTIVDGKCSVCGQYVVTDEAGLKQAADFEGAKIVLTEDINLESQLTITKKISIDGNGKTITRKTPTDGTFSDKSIILVSKTDGVEIKNLNVSGTGIQTAWNEGEFGIKVWESTNTVLENVSVTKTNAGIQVLSSDVVVKGTITLDGNTYGGIGVDKSSTSTDLGSLVIDGANIVCSSEKVPAIWLESEMNAIISGEANLTKAEIETEGDKIYYFTTTQDKWIESYGIIGRIDDYYYTDLETMAMDSENKTIVLLDDVTLPITMEVGWNLTLDLNGKTVTANSGNAFTVRNGAKATFTGNGTVIAPNCAIMAIEGAEVTVENGTYEGTFSVAAGSFDKNTKAFENGIVEINGGTFKSTEFTLPVWGESKLTVNGGDFTAKDNAVIGTNGSSPLSAVRYDITINGGTFNGNITTSGYIACGIYMANTGNVTLNGGTFNITGGVGVHVRSGNLVANEVTINLTEKEDLTSGKVGDSTVTLTTGSQIVVDDRAGYPGEAPEVSVNTTGYIVKDVDGNDYSVVSE